MTQTEIQNRVKAILLNMGVAEADEIEPEVSFRGNFAFDSLDQMDLCIRVEQAFGISMTDREAYGVETVGDLYKIINSKVNKKKHGKNKMG